MIGSWLPGWDSRWLCYMAQLAWSIHSVYRGINDVARQPYIQRAAIQRHMPLLRQLARGGIPAIAPPVPDAVPGAAPDADPERAPPLTRPQVRVTDSRSLGWALRQGGADVFMEF